MIAALGCGTPAPPAPTVALAEAARPGVVLRRGDEAIPLTSDRRVEEGAELSTPVTSRATVRLDGGAWALLDQATRLRVGAARLELVAGRVWIDARDVDPLTVAFPGGSVTATNAGFSLVIDQRGARVYCVSGQLTYSAQRSDRLEAGMAALITAGGEVKEEPEAQWDDWTGGLAEPGPPRPAEPAGVGQLAARGADEIGAPRVPLLVRRHDVRVRIDRDFAITDVEQVFFNPRSEEVAGIYSLRLPRGAVLGRFQVGGPESPTTIGDWLAMTPHSVPQVSESAPAAGAALEWAGPDRYRAQLEPVAPGKTLVVRVRYAEWLPRRGDRRSYVYRMGGGQAPLLGEFSLEVDTRDAEAGALEPGMGARIEGPRVVLRRSDFRPRADFALDLIDDPRRKGHGTRAWRVAGVAGEPGYVLVDVAAPFGDPAAAVDVVLVVDTSAATDPTRLDLARAVVDGVLRQLAPTDRVAVVAAAVEARPLGPAPVLAPLTRERTEQLLDALAREPAAAATDLGASLEQAAALLPEGRGVLVYIGDGRPTVGALTPGAVVDRLAQGGHPPRIFAIGVGADVRMDLLTALAAAATSPGPPQVALVEDRPQAAHAAYRILAAASLPTLREVTFDLGREVDVVYPAGPQTLVAGEPLRLVARLRAAGVAPQRLTIHGLCDAKPIDLEVPLTAVSIPDGGDIRRRWAGGRLDNLLTRGAGREAVAEIGTRFGLVTPWSALLSAGGGSYRPLAGVVEDGVYVPLALRDAAPDDSPIALEAGLTSSPSGTASIADLYRHALVGRSEGVRACYERKAAGHPELSGRVEVRLKIGLGGEIASAHILSSSLRNTEVEACMVRAIQALRLPPPPDAKILELVHAWQFEASDGRLGATSRCSAAARQYLASRRALWRERLASNGGVEGAMAVWRQAERSCELATWLDRRALLDLLRPHVGSTVYQIDLYHRFDGQADVQGHLRREILRAVRTTEDLRAIRGGLALDGGFAPELLEAELRRAPDVGARIKVLRRFLALADGGIALRLRLLALLEEAHRARRAAGPGATPELDEATRVAWSLRGDPAADVQARQAVGEFFARQGNPTEAARAFSEIVEFAPFDPWARRRLGDLLFTQGRFADAYREYSTLAWLTPDDGSVLLLLAQAAAGSGRSDEALRLQERLSEAVEARDGNDAPTWARYWTSVRLAALRDAARTRGDAAQLTRLAARGRADGVLSSAAEALIAVTWGHPDARLELEITHPGDKLPRRAAVQGGSVHIEAQRLARQDPRDYSIVLRRPAGSVDNVRGFDAELWLLFNEASDGERLIHLPLKFGPDTARIDFTLRGREVSERGRF